MEPFDELKEVKNPIIKEMLLQKYGIVPPKLTQQERANVEIEEHASKHSYTLEWKRVENWVPNPFEGGVWTKRQ